MQPPEAHDFEGELERVGPELCLVGNSVFVAATDVPRLAELLDARVMDTFVHGSASAIWYLLIKNVIAAAEQRPRTVVLGFRDVFLTEPEYRTQGGYSHTIDWYSGPDEELLDRLAYLRDVDPVELFALRHSGLWQRREELREDAEGFAKERLGPALAGATAEELRVAIDRVFAEDRKRLEAVNEAQIQAETKIEAYHFDFEAQLERSFLPEITRICRAAEMRLVLVRLPTQKFARARAGEVELPPWVVEWLPAYIDDLERWLDEREVTLLDFEDDSHFPLEHFFAGDHLVPDPAKGVFTELLAEKLKPLIR